MSWSLLEQLKEAHEQLLRQMDQMKSLTCAERPDDGCIARTRWQLSQASLRKRTLVADILDFLAAQPDRDNAGRLASVRAADQKLSRRSALHVRTWPISATGEDWSGYCAASRDIRLHMSAQILLEKQTLYPFLGRLADRDIRRDRSR